MLGSGGSCRAGFGRHGRDVHERHRQAPALGVAQGCVEGQVAERRCPRCSRWRPAAPLRASRLTTARRTTGERNAAGPFGDREVVRLRAVVVRKGKVEDVDRDALDRERLTAGPDAEHQYEARARPRRSPPRTAFGVLAAETGSTRPTTSSPATSSPSSAVATSPLGLISPPLYGWEAGHERSSRDAAARGGRRIGHGGTEEPSPAQTVG